MEWHPTVVETQLNAQGALIPRAFLWQGRRIEVHDWGRSWVEAGRRHALVMTATGSVYELRYDTRDGNWQVRPISERAPRV